MGKPDGPIEFNGKTVNLGDPEYAAASQALIASKQKMQQYRTSGGSRATQAQSSTAPAAAAQPSTAPAPVRDFEESVNLMRRLSNMLKG